jgi:hypothetical protein
MVFPLLIMGELKIFCLQQNYSQTYFSSVNISFLAVFKIKIKAIQGAPSWQQKMEKNIWEKPVYMNAFWNFFKFCKKHNFNILYGLQIPVLRIFEFFAKFVENLKDVHF